LIIVDDGSTDGTREIVDRYADVDPRIVKLINVSNQGIARSRNLALAIARGDYIACLDSDDVAEPRRLGIQLDFMQAHPDCVLLGSDLAIINEYSVIVGQRIYPGEDKDLRRVLPRLNPFAQPASMFNAETARHVGGYREALPLCEDYDLFLRLAEQGQVASLAQALTRYRISSTQTKARRLRQTLLCTLRVQKLARQRGWRESFGDKLYRLMLYGLFLLPQEFVLLIFKKTIYRTVND
jgi:glycosyltransferase involved in cell wall biosynthesis